MIYPTKTIGIRDSQESNRTNRAKQQTSPRGYQTLRRGFKKIIMTKKGGMF